MDPRHLPYAAAFLVCVAVFLVVQLLAGRLDRMRRTERARRKLETLGARARSGRDEGRRGAGTDQDEPDTVETRLARAFAGLFGSMGRRIGPRNEQEAAHTANKMVRAGFRQEGAVLVLWGVKAVLMVGMTGAFLTARMLLFPDMALNMALIPLMALAVTGMYAPEVWLWWRARRRRRDFFEALPDALDLMVVCVEAGMGLDQALSRVCQEMRRASQVLAEELRIVNLELKAGKPRGQALRDMAGRVRVEDLSGLVTLLIQSESFGTSIAQTLRVYSESLRTKRFQAASEKAAKLPVKILFPVIGFIFPALQVVIAGPAFLTLMDVLSAY